MNAILRSCLRLALHFLLSSVRGKLKLVIRVMKSRLESRTDWRAQSVKFLQEMTSTQGGFLVAFDLLVDPFPVRPSEILKLLDPLPLNILSRCDVENTKTRVKESDERNHSQGDIGFPHADFVGQVSKPLFGQHIVKGHSALELVFRESL